MERSADWKRDLFFRVGQPLWAGLKETHPTRDSKLGTPLHKTIFSLESVCFTKAYKDFPEVAGPEAMSLAKVTLQALANDIRVHIYEDRGFRAARYIMRDYARWCDTTYTGDYTTNAGKAALFLQDRIEEATSSNINEDDRSIKGYNIIKKIIPIIGRVAMVQGYINNIEDFRTGQLTTMSKDYTAKRNAAVDSIHEDTAATSRRLSKRFRGSERDDVFKAIWSGAVSANPKIQMRISLLHALASADGKRGMHHRAVSSSSLATLCCTLSKDVSNCAVAVAVAAAPLHAAERLPGEGQACEGLHARCQHAPL
jgi:hypothetical protein